MFKKRQLNVTAVLSVVLCLIVSASLLLGGKYLLNASTVSANVSTNESLTSQNENAVATMSTSSTPEKPSVDIKTYNTAIGVKWTAGYGADNVVVHSREVEDQHYLNFGTRTYTEYAFANKDFNKCYPQELFAKSYNSTTGEYSEATTIIKEERVNDVYIRQIVYYECLYTVVNSLSVYSAGASATVPTRFDQTDFIWDHTGKKGDIIRGTVRYGDEISNIDVTVTGPLVKKTMSVTLNGLTIYLRTGPNRCSIKVDKSGISRYDLKFAFGIQHNS